MPQLTLTVKEFQDYANWTAETWLQAPRSLGTPDYAIMTLGLSGETGEIADEVLECIAAGTVRPELLKELGDGVYYAARLFHAFELAPEVSGGWEVYYYDPVKLDSALKVLPQFTIAVGKVSEVMKKLIRDGVSPEKMPEFKDKLRVGLIRYIHVWMHVVAMTGWSPQDAIAANMQKINDRKARGVLQGSGNDR